MLQDSRYCHSVYGSVINNTWDKDSARIKAMLPKNFYAEDCLICAGVKGSTAGTCPGDSGGVLMETEWNNDLLDDRTTQKAIVHGSKSDCDGEKFPSVFVRLDNCDVLSWIYEKVFPDKKDSISCTPTTPIVNNGSKSNSGQERSK